MNFEVRLLRTAEKDLDGLDAATADRVMERLEWLAANLEDLQPESLKGPLRGLYKFRVGHYRVLYSLDRNAGLIAVRFVRHRSRAYD